LDECTPLVIGGVDNDGIPPVQPGADYYKEWVERSIHYGGTINVRTHMWQGFHASTPQLSMSNFWSLKVYSLRPPLNSS